MSNQWWGYLHEDGSVQAKRFYDQRDIIDANGSPFVDQVVDVFEANDRTEALETVKARLGIVE